MSSSWDLLSVPNELQFQNTQLELTTFELVGMAGRRTGLERTTEKVETVESWLLWGCLQTSVIAFHSRWVCWVCLWPVALE